MPSRIGAWSIALMLSLLPLGAESLPQHPRLLFNSEGINGLKQRVSESAWSGVWNTFRANFDKTIATKIELPPRGANWWHWYVCPRHGARLTTGKQIGKWEWEHICPIDNEILHGDPSRPDRDFDGTVLSATHERFGTAIRNGGVLYAVTGDQRYARRVREILMAYADRYLDYPLHDKNGKPLVGGGRITSQTLDEAVWLIPAAQGADLIWNTLTEEDQRTLAQRLFLPAARDVILAHRMGVHNIQCWKNSAVGLVGYLLGDETLIKAAIDDPDRGYRVQMAKGVQDDGVWFEGAWGYHFYTLSALWPLVEAAHNCGLDLYGEPLKKMFQAPVRLAMPNGKLPAFNDSTEVSARNDLYELAYARYRDPVLLLGLLGSQRRNDYALWFGVDALPAAGAFTAESRNFPTSGYAILQRGEGESATWLCLKYGPHGGGHGHFDKNSFVLYSKGRVLFPDPGTRPYGSPLHTQWDRTTLAHSTLTVDEKPQAAATGKTLLFHAEGQPYAMVDAGKIYPGLSFTRTAVMLEQDLIVFIDTIMSDRPHILDLAIHSIGRWTDLPHGEPVELPKGEGYGPLQDATVRSGEQGIRLQIDKTAITLAGGEPTEVITATGVGKSTEDRVPVTILRRRAARTVYAWAVSLDGVPASVKLSDDATLSIQHGRQSYRIGVNTSAPEIQIR